MNKKMINKTITSVREMGDGMTVLCTILLIFTTYIVNILDEVS